MPEMSTCEIAVIGAGVVGMAVAEALARAGREVVLIDPNDAGSGASYGNAGTIADYAVMPVGTPDVLRDLPRLLLDANSPLAIRRASILALAPWLLRFAVQSLPARAARNAAAIAALVADANARWHGLAAHVGGADILQQRGCLYLYEGAKGLTAAKGDMAQRRGFGVDVDILGAAELAAMEPALPPMAGAAFFPKATFLADPAAMMARMAAHLARAGLPHMRAKVTHLARQGGGVALRTIGAAGETQQIFARRVVIAAGAQSRALAAMAGDVVPLDTERGYHLEWDMAAPRLNRPACPTARGFYLCPMTGRLRAVGTVELGGLTAPPSRHRLDRLAAGARDIFPDLGTPSQSWMGFRPSMPDSLPVIGPSRAGGEVIHAFGHGHIGLTLAPITAAIVADIIEGRAPSLDIAPYAPTRFGRWI